MITRAEFREACEKAFMMMETAEIHLSETEPATTAPRPDAVRRSDVSFWLAVVASWAMLLMKRSMKPAPRPRPIASEVLAGSLYSFFVES